MVTAVHLGSIALIYAALLQSDFLEFLGLKQAWGGAGSLARTAPTPVRPLSSSAFSASKSQASTAGCDIRCLLGGCSTSMTCRQPLNIVVFTAMYALYMIIGSHYDEQRLISNLWTRLWQLPP